MILFRADANEHIGAGHVMRCLSLACALVAEGHEVLFVTADKKGADLITQAGFPVRCLSSRWEKMEEELPALLPLLRELRPSFTLVDSYFVTQRYFRAIAHLTRLVYLDDLNAERWDVNCLVNYNIFADGFDYGWCEKKGVNTLLMPQYAPLREEFQNLPKRQVRSAVTDVLVSAGGADPERITEQVMTGVCPLWEELRFHFLVGALNPHLEQIRACAPRNAVLHINEGRMSQLMRSCDIAISASGSTLYELCACGTPTVTYTMADNQLPAAQTFERRGVMLNAGDCRQNPAFLGDLHACLSALAADPALRSSLAGRMQLLVDGSGARRLAQALCTSLTV